MQPNQSQLFQLNQTKRAEIPGYQTLQALALNLIWSWNHKADRVWRYLDPILWELTCNPWVVLQTVSIEKLQHVLADPNFRAIVDELVHFSKLTADGPGWFQKTYPNSPASAIAYFSMEYMLSEALPIYSGGLGNVAGDQLKAASDLGVPVIGVGLLYQQGYFRQLIDKDGYQQAFYPYNDPGQLPISPLYTANGEWLRLEIVFPGWSLWLRTWQAKVGNVTLLLLDTNDFANLPAYRGITNELYGGGSEQRLQQEMVLGIGGWRLLKTLGLNPEVCHLNEGHAAFAILERARWLMKEQEWTFEKALMATRAGNVFTTHTAVPAGFDRFSPELMQQYLGRYAQEKLNITMETLMSLGRENPNDTTEYFNMAYLSIRGSHTINGVSHLHGKVSQNLFKNLFPRWPQQEVPVGYVTNGVHMPSWDSAAADDLWTSVCGECRWLNPTENLKSQFNQVDLEKIWQMRQAGKENLIQFVRARVSRQLAGQNAPVEQIEQSKNLFDTKYLMIGFARRFATYKRPTILLQDPERLMRLLTNPDKPVQLVLAGKAHPADKPGQELIHQWMTFIKKYDCRAHVVFLADYDMQLTEKMVQGVDVWINSPKRPWEACGTSGMKVLVNGGLNCSELDGWWEEAYHPDVGWALGDGLEHHDDPEWDKQEANHLYDLLEYQIIPSYYNRDAKNLPTDWLKRVRNSMATLTPHYSANRAVREYTEKYYLPAATAYVQRLANHAKLTDSLIQWQKDVHQNWQTLSFGDLKITTTEQDNYQIDVQVYVGTFDPQYLRVEFYADDPNGQGKECYEMYSVQTTEKTSFILYRLNLPKKCAVEKFTVRLITNFPGFSVPAERAEILWQH